MSIRMSRTSKGNWVGRFSNFKIILSDPGTDDARGTVEIPGQPKLIHAFTHHDKKEKMLRFTVQGFTHLFGEYPGFRRVYELVFKTEDGVEWFDPRSSDA